jgi:hypothetical protein
MEKAMGTVMVMDMEREKELTKKAALDPLHFSRGI